jgi:hypothetical protein
MCVCGRVCVNACANAAATHLRHCTPCVCVCFRVCAQADLLALNSELGEKTFNATMRFDIAQRHMKEIMTKDLQNLKSDLLAADQRVLADVQVRWRNMNAYIKWYTTIVRIFTLQVCI